MIGMEIDIISDEYDAVFKRTIKTKSEYEAVTVLDQNREQFNEIVRSETKNYCESRKEKVIIQREVTKKAEGKREEKKYR